MVDIEYVKRGKDLVSKLNKLKPEVWLFLILIFALFLRLYFFVGIGFNDDTEYSYEAYKFSKNGYKTYSFYSIDTLRTMMVIPLSLIYKLFGVSNFTAGVYPLILSIGSIFLTFIICKIFLIVKLGY